MQVMVIDRRVPTRGVAMVGAFALHLPRESVYFFNGEEWFRADQEAPLQPAPTAGEWLVVLHDGDSELLASEEVRQLTTRLVIRYSGAGPPAVVRAGDDWIWRCLDSAADVERHVPASAALEIFDWARGAQRNKPSLLCPPRSPEILPVLSILSQGFLLVKVLANGVPDDSEVVRQALSQMGWNESLRDVLSNLVGPGHTFDRADEVDEPVEYWMNTFDAFAWRDLLDEELAVSQIDRGSAENLREFLLALDRGERSRLNLTEVARVYIQSDQALAPNPDEPCQQFRPETKAR